MNLQQPAPFIPPVHPDVQMKPLPFYDVLDVLVKPSSLGASPSQRYHQEKYFIFALTPQQVREVCISRDFLPGGRRDYMVQIQLRFCLAETSCPQDDNFPNSLCVKVNGKLFPLPGLAPPPKNGIEQKKSGRPLNITSLVRLSSAVPNQIAVTWAPEIGKAEQSGRDQYSPGPARHRYRSSQFRKWRRKLVGAESASSPSSALQRIFPFITGFRDAIDHRGKPPACRCFGSVYLVGLFNKERVLLLKAVSPWILLRLTSRVVTKMGARH
ncbi:E3 SUMO-protein ligase PIAS2 isoform X1 [Fundulus heteroclitus]|uniref:E3 SUMO-protein ligase PIAS2 isoform X1 n=1 Tax=Fundulus heteroclitus TaxID=8078 RepID=UPI00165AB0A2|nr:E3 SUMO-protein ligase PIAS2 isoform X1 [Fundulus heteroclitus]